MRWLNHSRATKIGQRMWNRKALCSNGEPCRSRIRKRIRPSSRLVHLGLAAGERDAGAVDDREIVGHRVVEPHEAVIEDLDRVVGDHFGHGHGRALSAPGRTVSPRTYSNSPAGLRRPRACPRMRTVGHGDQDRHLRLVVPVAGGRASTPTDLQPAEFLAFYATRFDTVELNSTGYRLPSADQFRRWAEAVPDGFEFAVKFQLTRLDRVTTFLERVLALGDRLGPVRVLYEGPRDDGTLSFVLGSVPEEVRLAWDFRDESWAGVDGVVARERPGAEPFRTCGCASRRTPTTSCARSRDDPRPGVRLRPPRGRAPTAPSAADRLRSLPIVKRVWIAGSSSKLIVRIAVAIVDRRWRSRTARRCQRRQLPLERARVLLHRLRLRAARDGRRRPRLEPRPLPGPERDSKIAWGELPGFDAVRRHPRTRR